MPIGITISMIKYLQESDPACPWRQPSKERKPDPEPKSQAKAWLSEFTAPELHISPDRRRLMDSAAEHTTDLAPKSDAKAWLGEYMVPAQSTGKPLTEPRGSFEKPSATNGEFTKPEAAHLPKKPDDKESAGSTGSTKDDSNKDWADWCKHLNFP